MNTATRVKIIAGTISATLFLTTAYLTYRSHYPPAPVSTASGSSAPTVRLSRDQQAIEQARQEVGALLAERLKAAEAEAAAPEAASKAAAAQAAADAARLRQANEAAAQREKARKVNDARDLGALNMRLASERAMGPWKPAVPPPPGVTERIWPIVAAGEQR